MGAREKAKHKAENMKGKGKDRAAQDEQMRDDQATPGMDESGARDAADRARDTIGE
jgi:hypothetical protein